MSLLGSRADAGEVLQDARLHWAAADIRGIIAPRPGGLRTAGIEPRQRGRPPVWHKSRFFDARERAALGWAEALPRLPDGAPSQAAFDALPPHFDEQVISDWSMAVAVINAGNRLGTGLLPPLP